MPSESSKRSRNKDSSRKGANHSRDVILDAAIAEFSARGFDGARMEGIADRAGYNKSLVYRHFTDKKGLFQAALRHKLEERGELSSHMPKNLAENLQYWFRETLRDPEYLRMLMREALNDDGEHIVEESTRRRYYQNHVDVARRMQQSGGLWTGYDPECFILAVTALVLFPSVFPQIVRLIVGHDVGSSAFKRKWNRFLGQLAESVR